MSPTVLEYRVAMHDIETIIGTCQLHSVGAERDYLAIRSGKFFTLEPDNVFMFNEVSHIEQVFDDC